MNVEEGIDDLGSRIDSAVPFVTELVTELSRRGLTLAIAESLTGGLLTAEFVRPPGASAVLFGGVVAYATELKRDVIGVDAELLAEHGPVHPEVARQLADRVRTTLAVDGTPARLGLATTGVAGPDPQGDQGPGTVFVGIAVDDRVEAIELSLEGPRDEVRARTVTLAVQALADRIRGE